MDVRLVLLLTVVGFKATTAAQGSSNHLCGHGQHDQDCSNFVDAAILDVELYYDNHLCQELLQLDCAQHIIRHDEVLCGTDGNTYNNHCLFTQGRCNHLHVVGPHGTVLHIASRGACPTTTAAPTTTAGSTTQPPHTSHVVTGDHTSTTAMPTTTTVGATTVDPVHGVIANVFCQQASTIDCNTGFNVVCGSDNQYYPNDCELSKAKCLNPALVKVDPSNCQP